MLDPDVASFVLGSLPPAPARVLEVGAGEGELAHALAQDGYDVVAIDPASEADHVRRVRLHDLDEPRASFDAAVAVVSMHHIEPLHESCRRLGEVVRPGGTLVLDEIDVGRLSERAAGWWLEQHGPTDHGPTTPGEIAAFMRHHLHDLPTMRDALAEWFELGPPARGPYLYRWDLGPDLRGVEESLIAAGGLPAVGVRIVGTRRPDRA
jgi:SAM-dependent methyltransferase